MELDAPKCEACGAPVPLSDGAVATCVRCQTPHPIDEAHRALRTKAEAARARRREAEATLRRLERRLPAGLQKLYVGVVIPAVVIGVPVGFGQTQARYGWFFAEWIVFAGILPFMVSLLPALIMWSLANPQAYLEALGLSLRPAPAKPGAVGVGCGVCGAPLEVEADAYAATCDYCGADSWVREQPGGYDHAKDERREAAKLADLLRTAEFRDGDIGLLLKVYPTVTAIACVVLFSLLPGRAQLEQLRYSESVDGQWERLGRPGAVVDLALAGEILIAVGADGRVQERRRFGWREVEGATEMLGVAAAGDRALLVGRGGRAAWLDDGELEPVDPLDLGLGAEIDLNDAWLGEDGSAAVVGTLGASAIFDGRTWRVLDRTNDNELLAVWGRGARQLWAAGGISAWTLVDGQWSGETLQGLPRVVDVSGHGDAVYLATAPLDEESDEQDIWANVYARAEDGWDILLFGGSSYAALAVGPDALWAVGPRGYVQERSMPALHPPGSGDVLAALVWDGRLIVGGEDGVFEHRE